MNAPEFIETTLSNRMNATSSKQEVKNNRYHYYLSFDQPIGWDWLYSQVKKAQHELDTELELWEIHPGSGVFEIEVREVQRREGIDDNQTGLTEFER